MTLIGELVRARWVLARGGRGGRAQGKARHDLGGNLGGEGRGGKYV